MVDEQIVRYIKDAQKKGYSDGDIEITLIQYGHSPATIKEAMKKVKGFSLPQLHWSLPFSPLWVVGGIILIFIFLIGGFFIFEGSSSDDYELSANLLTDVITTNTLDIELEFQGINSFSSPVSIIYEIHSDTTLLSKSTEKITPSDSIVLLSYTPNRILPEGNYTLIITTMVNTNRQLKTLPFIVSSESIRIITPGTEDFETSTCPSSCDDQNLCTRNYCNEETNFQCVAIKIENCCGNSLCEAEESPILCPSDCIEVSEDSSDNQIDEEKQQVYDEIDKIISNAKALARENKKNGIEYCRRQQKIVYADQCFLEISHIINDSVVCLSIVDKNRKDHCYLKIRICEPIENVMVNRACEAFRGN